MVLILVLIFIPPTVLKIIKKNCSNLRKDGGISKIKKISNQNALGDKNYVLGSTTLEKYLKYFVHFLHLCQSFKFVQIL